MATKMTYTRLGNTGMKVSRLCLGTMTYGSKQWREWVLEEAESRPFIEKALEAGINFFDTADMYSNGASEEVLGRAIRDLVPDREDVVIATKCYNGTMGRKLNRWGLSRVYRGLPATKLAETVGNGLHRLDLYQIHRFDTDTPIEETIEALHDLVRGGGRGRCATSARLPCIRGSSPNISISPTCTVSRGSSRCRTTTIWSIGRRSGK